MIVSAISGLRRIVWAFTASSIFFGCISTRSFTYFQPVSHDMDEIVTRMAPAYIPVIKPGDVLSISVNSLDREDHEVFNPLPSAVTHQSQVSGFVVLQPMRGFTVDKAGAIVFPQVGEINVAGLTTKEMEIKLTDRLHQYIKSPTVSVHIANYIVTVVGEVVRPAQYVIPHNQITLPEALALAGDLTIYGKRKNILVIREIEGRRHFARIDLTRRDLFDSPYYHLHSGDYIYVEARKGRLTSTDRTYQLAPIIISSLTFILLIANTLTNK